VNILKPETITAVIAVAAVVSPVLTAWINNYYKDLADQRINDDKLRLEKQKQEEAKHQKFIEQNVRIRTIYEKYAEYTLELITSRGASSIQEQGKYFGLAMIYVDSSVAYGIEDKMSELQRLLIGEDDRIGPMEQDRYQIANDQFSIIASKLRELINSLPKE
jgi:mannitol-specific phosphotransferase system IIBC component